MNPLQTVENITQEDKNRCKHEVPVKLQQQWLNIKDRLPLIPPH